MLRDKYGSKINNIIIAANSGMTVIRILNIYQFILHHNFS